MTSVLPPILIWPGGNRGGGEGAEGSGVGGGGGLQLIDGGEPHPGGCNGAGSDGGNMRKRGEKTPKVKLLRRSLCEIARAPRTPHTISYHVGGTNYSPAFTYIIRLSKRSFIRRTGSCGRYIIR